MLQSNLMWLIQTNLTRNPSHFDKVNITYHLTYSSLNKHLSLVFQHREQFHQIADCDCWVI